ncbi:protoporphyrinogen/coproporphyrinogen oxidase [Shewanella vesiculosa]|uniref:protoporphyrinogen/coproporphyrinogen oxidase n=1 Tax=Shewanella vesiculosa TaxID=518738 RepID=UPI003D08432F
MNKKINVDVAILGAGIAGLGAALGAKNSSRKSIIFEANKSAGGLLDNFSVEGFRFDNAVHLSFATEPEVRSIFDKTPYYTHPSDSSNFEENKWLKHPVQNNLFPLSAADKVDLIDSFLSRPDIEDIQNYEQWLNHQYGTKIAQRFPLRYTKKYWQCEAKELSTTWIGNRMRRADFKELLHGSYTDETPNTYYTKEMRYPKKGGYKSFIEPLIDDANIYYEYRAISINLESREVCFENGDIAIFKDLVNTLPLPVFIELCGKNVPDNIKSAASKLEATSIDLISVGFNKPVIKDLWFYIYDEDIFASRAYSPSVKSKDNAPEGCSSLQFEIYNPGRVSRFTPDELTKNVLFAINKMNIAEDVDILFCEHKHLSWGNVTFKIGMEHHRKLVLDFMSQNNVKTAGRFGEWDYFWSNQSFLSGYNLYT